MSAPSMRARLRVVVRLLWCAVGAACGLGLALALQGSGHPPFLLASLGGSTVFLFGLGNAPAAQPRALFGGHLGGAFIGIACVQCFGDATWVYLLAQVLTLVFMLVTRTVHPPAGANPLIMVHAHAGFGTLLQPVLLSLICLVGVAFVWSRIRRDAVPYPRSWTEGSCPVDWGGQRPSAQAEPALQSPSNSITYNPPL